MKYIEPNLPKVQKKAYDEFNLSAIPGWETMIVFQVENLLLNNRYLILKSLDVHPHDIVADNPYIQRAGARQKGCQIDYLVHTHSNNLFICEFKFQRKELSSSVIDSMEDKLERFAAPKGFGICPVLFCLGDVAEEVHNRRYFYRIIDIADFLEGE